MGKEGDTLSFEAVRDYVFNVASQRIQMVKPVPMDVGCMEDSGNGGVCGSCEGWGCEQCGGGVRKWMR